MSPDEQPPPSHGTLDAVMRARGVSKVFGGTRALDEVDFTVRRGRVTALFGQNGAGKSTLMKILAGIEAPTVGALELDGVPIRLRSSVEAVAHGIAIIHQELNLCPNLNVTDNVFLGREITRAGAAVDYRAQREAAAALLERLEEPTDPDTLVGDLRLGQQQIVEIARALAQDARVLIMDEPTSALSAAEVEVLFRVIRELTTAGVSIVYISHHLEEALEIAEDVAVMRDGRMVAEAAARDVDTPWVVHQMVGRDPGDLFPSGQLEPGGELLRVTDLVVADPANPGRAAVDGVSLSVRQGEVVCLYGLMGAGRTELLETLAGRLAAQSGQISVDGRPVHELPIAERIGLGLALVPEDRQRDGLVQSMTVGENLSLSGLRQFVRGVWLSASREARSVARTIQEVTVKASGPRAAITSLSGGNQQKVVIGKVLLTAPRMLLLDEPTRGIDVGARADIFTLMSAQAQRGLAVLFATSEVDEALGAADRVLVMFRGRVVRELRPQQTTREELMVASGESGSAGGADQRGSSE